MDPGRLDGLPLFDSLSKKDRVQVAMWADEVDVGSGVELASEGSYAHEFFVIEQGNALVTKHGEPIGRLGPGDFFGEIALLGSDHHRTATVTASTPMRLIVMFQTEFRTMADQMPHVAEQLREAIRSRWEADRLRG